MDSVDLTRRAAIREAAMRLFTERGVEGVTLKQIALAADASAPLVIHHFGSKDALRQAVDDHVGRIFDSLFEEFAEQPEKALTRSSGASLAELMLSRLPGDSAVPAYLRRLLLSGAPEGTRLFRRWHELSLTMMAALEQAGVLRPGADLPTLTSFLMVNDLAMILLRDHLAEITGLDPLSGEGLARWGDQAMSAYRYGIFASPGEGRE